MRQALTEPESAAADIVSLNAGAAIYAAGVTGGLAAGVARAREVIASGAAAERLDALVRFTSALGAA